jgi:hypothetical protein
MSSNPATSFLGLLFVVVVIIVFLGNVNKNNDCYGHERQVMQQNGDAWDASISKNSPNIAIMHSVGLRHDS